MDKVLCIVTKIKVTEDVINQRKQDIANLIWNQEWYLDNDSCAKKIQQEIANISNYSEIIIPVYDHPHNDLENGQKEIHYHVDSRYLGNTYNKDYRYNLPLTKNQTLEYRYLTKLHDYEEMPTPKSLITKSKLKHKCIHKGKCPHRGYDLTKVKPRNGIITCPLHSLQFCNKTKKLIG